MSFIWSLFIIANLFAAKVQKKALGSRQKAVVRQGKDQQQNISPP
jgi:hypothetical protein